VVIELNPTELLWQYLETKFGIPLGAVSGLSPSSPSLVAVIAHSYPRLGLCQHIACSRTDEINVMHHAWVLQDIRGIAGDDELQVEVDIGVFGASGVFERHQEIPELQMRGAPFGRLEPRWCTVHHNTLSPCNNHIGLEPAETPHSFFTVSMFSGKVAVVYHMIAPSEAIDDASRDTIQRCTTIGELLDEIVPFFGPQATATVRSLVEVSL
jgi:hypothetical protein